MERPYNKFILPQEIYAEYLQTINTVRLSRREVDIIACTLNGRSAKGIAHFLSITQKTVEVHTYNAMKKLGCTSREGMISLIESTDQFLILKEHYLSLLTFNAFEKSLKEIEKLGTNLVSQGVCLIVYWEKNKAYFFQQLKSHLTIAGITTILEAREKKQPLSQLVEEAHHDAYTIYGISNNLEEYPQEILKKKSKASSSSKETTKYTNNMLFLFLEEEKSDGISKAVTELPQININDQTNYFSLVFVILKILLPSFDIDPIILQFKKKDDALNKLSIPINFKSHPKIAEKEDSDSESKIGKLPKSKKRFMLIALLIFVLSCFWLIITVGKQRGEKIQSHIKNITQYKDEDKFSGSFVQSDLVIPTESALLNRPKVLAQIAAQFKTQQQDIQTIALVGIGGAGKTTLARQYARSQKSSVIWEINAETKESIRDSFKELAHTLLKSEEEKKALYDVEHIEDPKEREEKTFQLVKESLRSHQSWLLIYDNVEKFSDIQRYFPTNSDVWGGGKVILTTRDAHIQHSGHINSIIHIAELDPNQKLNLFSKIINHKDSYPLALNQPEKYKEFLKDIPPFPLDILVAANYIKATNISYEDYLKNLKEHNKDFEDLGKSILSDYSNYDKTRYSIITLSLRHLVSINKDFEKLLLFISLLDSQNINKGFLGKYKGDTLADNFIYHLKKHSLIANKDCETGSKETVFSIHRSTQELIFSYILKNFNSKHNMDIIDVFSKTLETEIKNIKNKTDVEKLAILASHCKKFLNYDELFSFDAVISIRISLGKIYYYLGNWVKSQEICEDALSKLRKAHNKDHVKLLETLSTLGWVYKILSNYDKSICVLEEGLIIAKKYFPQNSIELASILTWLGNVYGITNNYKKGRELLEQSIKIYESQASKDNRKGIHEPLQHLANIYRRSGDYNKAEELFKKAIIICKKHFPENYILITSGTGNLGNVYREIGEYEKSKDYLEKSLFLAKKKFSKCYMIVGWFLEQLGKLHTELGDYQKAKYCFEESLAIAEKIYPGDNISTAQVLAPLGHLQTELKNYKESKKYLERSFMIYKKVGNNNQLEVAEVLLYLGKLHRELKNYKESKSYLEKSFMIFKQLLGEYNIKTSWVLAELGILYANLGDYKKGKIFLERSLLIHEEAYKINHIKTARILLNLGHIYLLEENMEVAKTFLWKALLIFQVYKHPDRFECLEQLVNLSIKNCLSMNFLRKLSTASLSASMPTGFVR